MIWGIIFDVVLWIAAVVLLICAAVQQSIALLILGLLCALVAVVLTCILTGEGHTASSLLDDIIDSID
jgi:hypothetical protein